MFDLYKPVHICICVIFVSSAYSEAIMFYTLELMAKPREKLTYTIFEQCEVVVIPPGVL